MDILTVNRRAREKLIIITISFLKKEMKKKN